MYVWNDEKGEFEYPAPTIDEEARLEACSETAVWVRQHLEWCDQTLTETAACGVA